MQNTNYDGNAWGQVDLGVLDTMNWVVVWNRTDCGGDRLSDYWVFISNTPFNPTDTPATLQNRTGTWNSHQTTAPNPSANIPVPGVQGRYLRVQRTGTNFLSLAKVQVMGTLGATPVPDLITAKTHTGTFTQGQIGATYTITLGNSGNAPTAGTLTAPET